MNFRNRWKLATNFFMQRLWQNIIMIVLITLSFSLLAFVLMYYHTVNYCEKSADETLVSGIEGTKVISIPQGTLGEYDMLEFYQELYESPYIEAAGCFLYGGNPFSCFDELKEIQYGHALEYLYSVDNTLELMRIMKELMPLCSLEVEKGIQPENLENTDENHSMIYLGYAYKDIPVGTVYSQNYYGTTYEYEVAGILKKGQRFLSEDVLLMTTDTLQVYDNLDYAVLVVDDEEVFSGQGYIAVKKGMESEALALIDETAEKYSITYQLENLTPLFEEVKEENLEFIKQTAAMTGFMLILSIFLMGSRQMIYILKQQREFAVLYAQGVSEKDLLTAILMETLQRMLAAFLLVMFTIWILGRFVLDGTSQLITSMTDMLMHSVYPELAVIMFAVGIISVIIPLVLMHRKMPVDLLRED